MLLLLLGTQSWGARKDELEAMENEQKVQLLDKIEVLKKNYRKYQEAYKDVSEKRWSHQKLQLTRKEENKFQVEGLRQKLELLYAELARAKEESLLKQQTAEGEKEKVKERREVWEYLEGQVDDKIEKDGKLNRESFPLDMELRARTINEIQLSPKGFSAAEQKLRDLYSVRIKNLQNSTTCGAARRTIIVGDGEPITAHVLRIGQVTSWALNEEGRLFMMTSLGEASSFEWSEITDPSVAESMKEAFPQWMKNRKVEGALSIDILQNERTRDIVSREDTGYRAKMIVFAQAGGPILIPMALLVLWAFFLIVNRWFVYFIRQRRSKRLLDKTVLLLTENRVEDAKKLVAKRRGLAAGLVQLCLKSRSGTRETAEQNIEEYLLKEGPKLDRYLDTISVIAGASPLLGLLGTVTGMIRLFEVITRVGTGDPKMMAGGISEALITTEVGLAIAIPLVLLHNWLRSRKNELMGDTEMYAMQILNRLWGSDNESNKSQHNKSFAVAVNNNSATKESNS